MENQTSVKYFYIMMFSDNTISKTTITLIFILLFWIYLGGILINASIITVIFMESHLHHPMYLFICNLSFVDMLFTTVTVPKFLYVLLSENNIVSFAQCYTQFCCYFTATSMEEMLLFIMAYDRYVAICIPLHYHHIMSKRNCAVMTIVLWVMACLNSMLFTFSLLNISTCKSNIIQQFFCDIKSMTRTTCTGSGMLNVVIAIEMLLFGFGPFSCSIISYINIFSVILAIKASEGRRKAFSTCSSHLSVMTMYYTSAMVAFLLPVYSGVMDFLLTAIYTTVIPMLNPIIYSLQNSGIKKAVRNSLGKKTH